MRKVDTVIVHCSATPEGKAYTADDIRRWHTTPKAYGGRGWSDIGYHLVIGLDGTVWGGRPFERAGAHARGFNKTSIGVCYIGGVDERGKPKDTRTDAQKDALRAQIRRLVQDYPITKIFGHRRVSAKACPCFNARKEYASLLR